jgi:hypothetical protein
LWAFGQGRGGHWTSAVNTRACIRRALRNRSK